MGNTQDNFKNPELPWNLIFSPQTPEVKHHFHFMLKSNKKLFQLFVTLSPSLQKSDMLIWQHSIFL